MRKFNTFVGQLGVQVSANFQIFALSMHFRGSNICTYTHPHICVIPMATALHSTTEHAAMSILL